jgi:sialic acid synthase SpsE
MGTKMGVMERERPVKEFARASVVVVRPVAVGEPLTLENIWVKRPADGEIPAREYKKVLGRVARVAMAPDHQVKWSELG